MKASVLIRFKVIGGLIFAILSNLAVGYAVVGDRSFFSQFPHIAVVVVLLIFGFAVLDWFGSYVASATVGLLGLWLGSHVGLGETPAGSLLVLGFCIIVVMAFHQQRRLRYEMEE